MDHLLGWFCRAADIPSTLLGLGRLEGAGPALCPANPQDLLSSGAADPYLPRPVAGRPCSGTLGPCRALAPKMQILICFLTRPQPDPALGI